MFKDKGGWRVAWREAGQRRSKWFLSKPEAKRFEAERALGTAYTGPAERTSPTFEAFAERWLRKVCEAQKAESQWVKDRETITNHLLPAFGSVRLVNLRKSHLLDLKADMRQKRARSNRKRPRPEGEEGKCLAPKTVNNALAIAKQIMAHAVDHDMVSENPWRAVKLFKLPEREFSYWTPSERDEFLLRARDLDPEFTRLCAVACHTGLRLGELAALRRQDLDFERKVIRVRGTWLIAGRKDGHDEQKVTPTKGKEVASIEMNAVTLQALEPARFLKAPEAWVFDRALFWSARHRLGRLARKVGVSPIRFHDLRHTFASCLAMGGVPLMAIQQHMRHKSHAMTLRYAHLHPSHLTGTLDVLTRSLTRSTDGESKTGGPRGT